MSDYAVNKINNNIVLLEKYIDQVDVKVLEPYKAEIKKLPNDQQKVEWFKYQLIENMITQAIETIDLLNKYQDTMVSKREFQQAEDYITALRKYIYTIGGNPSNVTRYKKTDR